jgi:hypothetical protein
MIRKLILTTTALGAAAAMALPAVASADTKAGVGAIYVKSWTKPYHQELRVVTAVSPWHNGSHVTYKVWRQVPTGWRLISRRIRWCDDMTYPASGWGAQHDTQTYWAYKLGIAGLYRWRATLHGPNGGTVSTAFRTFSVYYR